MAREATPFSRILYAASLCFILFFFPKNLNFSWIFFQKLKDHHINPTKYISFHVFFFQCASGVPRGRHPKSSVGARQRKSSKSEQRIERLGDGYHLKGHQWCLLHEKNIDVHMCTYTVHISGKHSFFFWGGGENIAQTCKMTRSIE